MLCDNIFPKPSQQEGFSIYTPLRPVNDHPNFPWLAHNLVPILRDGIFALTFA